MNVIVRFACAALILGASAPTLANAQEPVTRGPYVQLATPDSMIVVWRTDGQTNPSVRYGTSPDDLDMASEDSNIVTRSTSDVRNADRYEPLFEGHSRETAVQSRRERRSSGATRENTFQYEVKLTDLDPSTTYYYAIYDGREQLAGGTDYYFKTSPPHGEDAPMRFWVVGDSGTGGRDQKAVHEAMQKMVLAEQRPLDYYLHVGDMAYNDGTDYEFQRRFFDIYQDTLKNVVIWPTMGNHEGYTSRGRTGVGPYYDAYVMPTEAEAGGVPSGTEAYYSFNIGNIHFVCLDSHDLDREPTGAMAQWLRQDLEAANADWLIAFWHHPPYTKGSHDSDNEGQLIEMRTHIMPILEAGGVDMVFTGHSHIYERSMLMDGAYETPTFAEGKILDDGDGHPEGDGPYRKSAGLQPHEGTVQVVAGHGGTGVRRGGTMPVMREIIVEHGSVIIDVEGDTLTGRMLDKHYVIRDLFQIVKRGEVNLEPIANPWQPAPMDSE